LGQLRYLSCLQFVDAVVGNSSSGLLEVPSFKIATINIGNRQKGRKMATSVIDCNPITDKIYESIQKVYTLEFQRNLLKTVNPYGNGGASIKIKNTIKNYDLERIIYKSFYNISK